MKSRTGSFFTALVLGVVLLASVTQGASKNFVPDTVFSGSSLNGWSPIGKARWRAENGEIVCALIDGEATLKRFYKKDGVVTLKAENEKYAPIVVAEGEFRIAGKIVGLLRKF